MYLILTILFLVISYFYFFATVKYSSKKHELAESKLLSTILTPYKQWSINIGPVVGNSDCIINTVCLNPESKETPLLFLHGTTVGMGNAIRLLEHIAINRPIYAIDILGFGRSSIPTFSKDPLVAEQQVISSIEEWRKKVKLNTMYLLGNSYGCFLGASYAISYPNRVKHLILLEPSGFTKCLLNEKVQKDIPLYTRILFLFSQLIKLGTIARFKVIGKRFLYRRNNNILKTYDTKLIDRNIIKNYLYEASYRKSTGFNVANSMCSFNLNWKHPMIDRIGNLHPDVPITVIYGSKSSVDRISDEYFRKLRNGSYIDIQIIDGGEHIVLYQKPEQVCQLVNQVCMRSDFEK
ncbi:hypothetical protein DMENIID0001_060970 [Sergentomyia squamirostris]